jgi:hypothetical protein
MSPIRQQLLNAIDQTPDTQLEQVLTFLDTLLKNNDRWRSLPEVESSSTSQNLFTYDEKIRQWESLSDDIAHQLRDEFADEDRAIAELSVLSFAQFAQATET